MAVMQKITLVVKLPSLLLGRRLVDKACITASMIAGRVQTPKCVAAMNRYSMGPLVAEHLAGMLPWTEVSRFVMSRMCLYFFKLLAVAL